MDLGEFDSLAGKVDQALALIQELKRERDQLKTELHASLEKAGHLEQEIQRRDESMEGLRFDLDKKSENIHHAGERIRDLMGRLETALA